MGNLPLYPPQSARAARRTLAFSFDGQGDQGFAGGSLASALVASGVTLFGRSFKYHRPRGLVGMGPEEPNALVGVDRGPARITPNLRAPQVALHEGLMAKSQNRWPSLKFDVAALNDVFGALFPAGFYNKTLMWPRSSWGHLYEPVIRQLAGLGDSPVARDPDHYDATYAHCDVDRQLAGLGDSPVARDPDHYDATYAHCDVLVVGGGMAGIAAALDAAAQGGR
eukprot:gene7084-9071_t